MIGPILPGEDPQLIRAVPSPVPPTPSLELPMLPTADFAPLTGNVINAANCGSTDTLTMRAELARRLMADLPRGLAVETAYLGATDHRGSRVKATMAGTKQSVISPYDHSLNTDAAHLAAALQLLGRWFEGESLQVIGYTDTDKGFLFWFAFA